MSQAPEDGCTNIRNMLCFSLHKDTTPPQPNHTVTPTHIEPEQYTHTQSQAPEDECTSIRNMLSKKIKQVTSFGLSLFKNGYVLLFVHKDNTF